MYETYLRVSGWMYRGEYEGFPASIVDVHGVAAWRLQRGILGKFHRFWDHSGDLLRDALIGSNRRIGINF